MSLEWMCRDWSMLRCLLSTSRGYAWVKGAKGAKETAAKPPDPLRPPRPPRITLVSPDNSIAIVEKSEAENIAKIKHFKLVKIIDYDAQTRRPLYKLMTPSEFLKEEMLKRTEKKEAKNKSSVKGRKVLPINTKISDHDLQTRVNMITKWIGKSYEIKVVISGDSKNLEKSEKVFTKISEGCPAECSIHQKVVKGGDIKFIIYPRLKSNTSETSSDGSQGEEPKNHSDESNKL